MVRTDTLWRYLLLIAGDNKPTMANGLNVMDSITAECYVSIARAATRATRNRSI